MRGLAAIDRGWWLSGGLEQWRRITGVMRSDLLSRPLYMWADPRDAVPLARLWRMAEHGPWREQVRIGHEGRRALVELDLGQWSRYGLAPPMVRAVEPLPLSAWWLRADAFAGQSIAPTGVLA